MAKGFLNQTHMDEYVTGIFLYVNVCRTNDVEWLTI